MDLNLPKLPQDKIELIEKVVTESDYGHRQLFDSLSIHERDFVVAILRELSEKGSSSLLNLFWEIDFLRKPATPYQFITDKYYFAQCDRLFDRWKEDLVVVLDPNSGIIEHILTGGIGDGKTTVACLEQAYKVHYVSCMRSPQEYYGLMGTSAMVFGLFNITLDLEFSRAHKILTNMLRSSPYFRDYFPPLNKHWTRFPNDIEIIAGSTSLHALGADIYSGVLDELNFMYRGAYDERGAAFTLFSQVKDRMESRFMSFGAVPGLLSLVSSKRATTDFLDQHIKACENDPTVYVSSYAIWEVKPESYSGKTFFVKVGDRYNSSRIMRDTEIPDPKDLEAKNVISVPVEERRSFEIDIELALQNKAGVSTQSSSPLIPIRERVFKCIDETRSHPFSVETVILNLLDPTSQHIKLQDYFIPEMLLLRTENGLVPKIHPQSPRYIHVDIGLVEDALGFGMCHSYDVTEMLITAPDGTESKELAPLVYTDFVLQVKSDPGFRVDLIKVIEFILYLRRCNFPIELVTFDRFQSEYLIQLLLTAGIESKVQSVDLTDIPYVTLMRSIMEGHLSYYEYPILQNELVNLQRLPSSKRGAKFIVDHPAGGSKDVSDGLAGSFYTCFTDPRALGSPLTDPIDVRIIPSKSPNIVTNEWLTSDYTDPGGRRIDPSGLRQLVNTMNDLIKFPSRKRI